MTDRLYSAVVDPHGAFLLQAERLVWSLTERAGVSSGAIVLHVVGEPAVQVRRSLENLGVEVVHIDAYPGHPYCNKLQQLELLGRRAFDEVVLLDCDVLVLEEPPRAEGHACGKIVDFGVPPVDLLQRIFAAADLELRLVEADVDGEPTVHANANGGVYVIDRVVLLQLADAWREWAAWCLRHVELFGVYGKHVDQLSFAMAVAAEGIPFRALPRRFNVPTHVPQPEALDCEPAVLHYHDAVDTQQFLQPVEGLSRVNAAIAAANAQLLQRRRAAFDNAAFWSARYVTHPDLGSGIGTRGALLDQKRDLLVRTVDILGAISVNDVGGGDGMVAGALPDHVTVTALDVAESARGPYLRHVPHADWRLHDISMAPSPTAGELTVCLDLLIHQQDPARYENAVHHLTSADGALLISGFEAPPVDPGPMTYFHEPLSMTLERFGRTGIPVDAYRDTTVFLVLAPHSSSTDRDLREVTLRQAVPLVQRPLLLAEAIVRSRTALGFFPDHLPRCLEYPWIAERLDGHHSLRVIDAGAGVSVLPLLLADRGHDVTTLDPHPLDRTRTPREEWNEWGFLDYGHLHPRIRSLQSAYEQSDAGLEVDAIVSVSVVEHLPAELRRVWFRLASRQLTPGGKLLLTVDTVPFSDQLWGYSAGRQVEEPAVHGAVKDLLGELEDAGFQVEEAERSIWLPCSRVGMARICARR